VVIGAGAVGLAIARALALAGHDPSAAGRLTEGDELQSRPSGVYAIGSSSRYIPTEDLSGLPSDLIVVRFFPPQKPLHGFCGRNNSNFPKRTRIPLQQSI
jgi:hypothetical protein